MEEDIQIDDLIEIALNDKIPVKARLDGFERLKKVGTTTALIAIFEGSRCNTEEIAKFCEDVIEKISYNKVVELLNAILEGQSMRPLAEKRVLEVVYLLRDSDLLKYILQLGETPEIDRRKQRILQLWLRDSNAIKDYVQLIIAMPIADAQKIAKSFARVEPELIRELANLASHVPRSLALQILDILSLLIERGQIPKPLFFLIENKEPQVRARSAELIGRFSKNVMLFKRLLDDRNIEVQRSALKTIRGLNRKGLDQLISPFLEHPDREMRMLAAKVDCEHGSEKGLSVLLMMFDSHGVETQLIGAIGLGEVAEITMYQKIQELARSTQDEQIIEVCQNAIQQINTRAKDFNKKIAQIYFKFKRMTQLDITAVQDILSTAELLNSLSKDQLTLLAQRITRIPVTARKQIRTWVSRLGNRGETLLPMIAFWEASENIRGIGEIFVPTRFDRYLSYAVQDIDHSDSNAKSTSLNHFFHASTTLYNLIKDLDGENYG